MVLSEKGMFRSALGHVMPGIPALAPPQLTSPMALQKALDHLVLAPAPWDANPAAAHAPVGRLLIVQKSPQAQPTDFALAWYFALGHEAGVPLYSAVSVDARSGEILRADKAQIVE